jgi:hypothetical protein
MKVLMRVGMAAMGAVLLIEAQSGHVSGTFTLDGKPVKLTAITAVTYDTASQGRMVSVLASDKPADAKKFKEYTQIGPGEKYVPGMITGAWVAMQAEDQLSGFQFTFNSEKALILNDVLVGRRNDNFSIIDDYLVLELKSVTPRLVGRLRTKDPVVDLGSQKVGIDLTFDTPVSEVK